MPRVREAPVRRLLIDTSVWIEVLRNPESEAAARMMALPDDAEVILSSIVAAELAEGFEAARGSRNRRGRFDSLAAAASPASFGLAEAAEFGRVRAKLREQEISIGRMDELIAAQALALGAAVATLNASDFSRVPGLRVVDWSQVAR